MKIGVIFHGNPIAGGCYQQSLNATRLLSKDKESNTYIYYTPDANNANNARKDGIVVKNFRFGRKQRLIHKLRKFSLLHRFFGKFAFFEAFDIAFEKDDVDLKYSQIEKDTFDLISQWYYFALIHLIEKKNINQLACGHCCWWWW